MSIRRRKMTRRDENRETTNYRCEYRFQTVPRIVLNVIVLFAKLTWILLEALYKTAAPAREKPVKGEIVLVTGAGHGIGRALALEYASHGATVVCWDINEKLNRETVEEIFSLGYPKAYGFKCDVAVRDQVRQVAKRVRQEVGDVSILVNNAGVMHAHTLLQHTEEEIRRLMDINVVAHFWTLQEFLPIMRENNRGHVVAVSSCCGLGGLKNLTAYAASKFAVRGLMESLHEELRADRGSRIKITIVYPYAVDTGLCKNPVVGYSIFDLQEPDRVARTIVSLQRRDVFEATVPRYILTSSLLAKLLPRKAVDLFIDATRSSLESDLF